MASIKHAGGKTYVLGPARKTPILWWKIVEGSAVSGDTVVNIRNQGKKRTAILGIDYNVFGYNAFASQSTEVLIAWYVQHSGPNKKDLAQQVFRKVIDWKAGSIDVPNTELSGIETLPGPILLKKGKLWLSVGGSYGTMDGISIYGYFWIADAFIIEDGMGDWDKSIELDNVNQARNIVGDKRIIPNAGGGALY